MKVLLSIKPEYAERILEGEKRFEFRKVLFKNCAVKTVVIYATKPVGKVVGEFEIESVISGRPNKVWNLTAEFAGISQGFFNDYFLGRETAYAIEVSKVKRYEEPLDLNSLLPHGIAPQSFCYL